VFLLEVVIIIAIEEMRLVATKKPGKLWKHEFAGTKWDLPRTPMVPVEILFPQSRVDGVREESSEVKSGFLG
jgi:hypothetical protein